MKKENGITLVTLIVYLMIVSAILAALTNLSSHVYKNIGKVLDMYKENENSKA